MPVIRVFIAIELPADIQDQLRMVINKLSPTTRMVRWVPPENIHLTIKFLGDVESSQILPLQGALKKEVEHFRPFEIHVGGLGAFPNARRPRVIWIGVKAPVEIATLAQAVDTVTIALGFPSEDRPFSPHLTSGRISQHASPDEVAGIGAIIAKTVVNELGKGQVDALTLFRSDLRPTGAVYTPIDHIKLAKAA